MRSKKRNLLIVLGLIFLLPFSGTAQYKDFVRKETRTKLFVVEFDKTNVTVCKYLTESSCKSIGTAREKISYSDAAIKLFGNVSFTPGGLVFQDTIIEYGKISDVEILTENELTRIIFYTGAASSSRIKELHEGNIITFSDPISVKKGEFVRGMVLSIKGAVTVGGEVNKDILSLFGDVSLLPGAVARGDIASITGKISVAPQVSLYGEIYSGTKDYDSRQFKFNRANEFEPGILFNYNRVDGILLGGKLSFTSADSSLPSAEMGLGYAMESERLRYHARASQILDRKRALSVGAEYYKKLDSPDDWLLSNAENAIFVFWATEDYKDYYETEGLKAWIGLEPTKYLMLQTGFQYDDTHWLRAHRYLWSMFGGDKIFGENFGSVAEPYRDSGISEINSSEIGSIFLKAEYETRNFDADSNSSGWMLSGDLEWTNSALASDYDYHRYNLSAIRYQYLNNAFSMRFRGKFANSDKYLPMNKRYFLGGLGTLPGYRNKEFMGTRYWMTNAELLINLPLAMKPTLFLIWDAAQIANDGKLDGNAEIKHDLGMGIEIASLRFDVAKRLDSAADRDPKISVRFARRF